jgi:hypothetical protein
MRHECSHCSGEFFDDAPSGSPLARVFCVFCGTELDAPRAPERSSGVPFGPDVPRQEAAALGVIGRNGSEFPDTLRQFRASGTSGSARADSLSPVQTEPDDAGSTPDVPPWRRRKFWTSLAIGFAVGATAAALLGDRTTAAPPASAPAMVARIESAKTAEAPPSAATGCPAVSAVPPPPSVAVVSANKPPVTPTLERRFWLERARAAQRDYRLADAERLYQRVLALSPRDSETLTGAGELQLLRGAPQAAESRFREALEANANYLPALVALADLHWLSGDADEARREYQSIVDRFSADAYPPYVNQRLSADSCVPQCK